MLGALLLGGWYGGIAGAVGMTIADIMDPVYITVAPKTFVLKLCIGLITGLVRTGSQRSTKVQTVNTCLNGALSHRQQALPLM